MTPQAGGTSWDTHAHIYLQTLSDGQRAGMSAGTEGKRLKEYKEANKSNQSRGRCLPDPPTFSSTTFSTMAPLLLRAESLTRSMTRRLSTTPHRNNRKGSGNLSPRLSPGTQFWNELPKDPHELILSKSQEGFSENGMEVKKDEEWARWKLLGAFAKVKALPSSQRGLGEECMQRCLEVVCEV